MSIILFQPWCVKRSIPIKQLFPLIWESDKEVIDLEWLMSPSATQDEYIIHAKYLMIKQKHLKCSAQYVFSADSETLFATMFIINDMKAFISIYPPANYDRKPKADSIFIQDIVMLFSCGDGRTYIKLSTLQINPTSCPHSVWGIFEKRRHFTMSLILTCMTVSIRHTAQYTSDSLMTSLLGLLPVLLPLAQHSTSDL